MKIQENSFQTCDKISGARGLLFILKYVGLWPWDKGNEIHNRFMKKVADFFWIIVYFPGILIFCILMCLEVITASDLDEVGNVLYMSLTLVMHIVKWINLRVLNKKATSLFHELENNKHYDFQTSEEVKMWSKHQKSFRHVVLIFTTGSVSSVVFAFVGVLFLSEYSLAYPYYVPFEWHNPGNYWYAYFFDVQGMLMSCISNVTLDMFGCYMIFHIGLLYKLLVLRFSRIKTDNEEQAIKELRKLYQMHMSIKTLTKDVEILISFYIFAQIFFSAVIICFCGFRMQKMHISSELGQFFSMLQFSSIMILEIYLPCHFSNQTTQNSGQLLFKIYETDWMSFSAPNRKFVLLYMEFFKKPEILRAGHIFEVGLPVFSKVLSNAYSFFALLLNVDKKNK